MTFFHELAQFALAGYGVREVQTGKLNLTRTRINVKTEIFEQPVIERTMFLKFQRADRMRNALDGIGQRMGKVVHRIDAPGITRAVMMGMGNAVDNRVAHNHIRRGHVNFGAQHLFPVSKFAGLHTGKQVEVFLHTAVAVWAFLARLRQRTAVFLNLVCRQVIHISQAFFNQFDRIIIELIKVIRRIVHAVLPAKAQPTDIFLNGIHVFRVLLGRIGIIKAQIAQAMIILCQAKVQAYRLGMTNMQIAIGLGWETGVNPFGVFTVSLVFLNRILHKVRGDCRVFCHYILSFIYALTSSAAAHFFLI